MIAILLAGCGTTQAPEHTKTPEAAQVETAQPGIEDQAKEQARVEPPAQRIDEAAPALNEAPSDVASLSAPETKADDKGHEELERRPAPSKPQPLAERAARKNKAASMGSLSAMGAGRAAAGVGVAQGAPSRMYKREASMDMAMEMPLVSPAAPVAAPVAVEKDSAEYEAQPSSAGDTERYAHVSENAFEQVKDAALSTFSIDVDTASYSNVRRFLRDGVHPPTSAVRIEEMLNYFHYDYATPSSDSPVAVSSEVSTAPWNSAHRLVRIGLRSAVIEQDSAPASNLVFLLDVSGSMQDADKLPLLKNGLSLMAKRLRPQDHVAIVVYAGASGLALPSTSGDHRERILEALDKLEAGGSTNGADGIRLAYQVAQQNFVKDGVNRVILATDGDFNVGTTSEGELVKLIEDKRKSGVFLTVLGFGRGNLNDSGMEALADHGNGNYGYIDSIAEAHKILVREAGSTLVTVAKDVKLQIEWNPARVASYRLIGFENRRLADRDFNDDKKDAGELGADHSVTALYEVVPTSIQAAQGEVDPLRYQGERVPSVASASDELLTVKVRYKRPNEDQSRVFARTVKDDASAFAKTSQDFRWAAAVAGFGMILRESEHKGSADLKLVRSIASEAVGSDLNGERHEMIGLIDRARSLGFDAHTALRETNDDKPRIARSR